MTNHSTPSTAAHPAWLDRQAYPFAPRFLPLTAGRMHYVDEGQGETILFVHGTPTWSFEFRHLIRALSKTHRCVAPDALGFGLSERPRDFAYTPEAHAAVLAEFVQKLGLTNYTLVVHDFGGPIGLPLCLHHPDQVSRLVLFNTWMWPFDDDPEMQKKGRIAGGAIGRLLYRHVNFSLRVLTPYAYGDKKKLTPAIHQQYLSVFPDADSREQVLWALAKSLNGSRDYYSSLWEQRNKLQERPALILWGMKDRAFPPHMLDKWRVMLPAATVVPIENAGHWPHEEAPDTVVSLMAKFLS